jgi:hypothetical protein
VRRALSLHALLTESIADLNTLLFSSLQYLEGGGDGDSGDSCADIFEDQNLTYSLSPSFLRLLAKNL